MKENTDYESSSQVWQKISIPFLLSFGGLLVYQIEVVF
jgi:hypothetical protein